MVFFLKKRRKVFKYNILILCYVTKTFLNVFIKNILDLRRVLFMDISVRFVTGTQIIFAYQNLKKIS